MRKSGWGIGFWSLVVLGLMLWTVWPHNTGRTPALTAITAEEVKSDEPAKSNVKDGDTVRLTAPFIACWKYETFEPFESMLANDNVKAALNYLLQRVVRGECIKVSGPVVMVDRGLLYSKISMQDGRIAWVGAGRYDELNR